MGDLPRKDDGLIVMGDLPSGKEEEWSHSLGDLPRGGMASFLWVTYPDKKMENGLILMADLPRKVWSHCDG